MSPLERRFAVVGCGSIGSRHLRNLAALGCRDLIAVDPDPARSATAAAASGAETAPDLASALAAGATVVLVTSPTAFHLPAAVEAVRAGADLFVEKPLAASLLGVPELLDEARAHGTTALVACNLRFHPGLALVHELLATEAIGTPLSARIEFGSWLPDWRPGTDYLDGYAARRELGGGIVLDAIHELDYARWLLGEVRSVSCFADSVSSLGLETEDVAAILLRFESGALGEIHLDYLQRSYSRTCQLIGEEGTLRWDFASGETALYAAASRSTLTFANPPGWEPNDMYLDELRHFLACLGGEAEPVQDLAAGAAALELACAALDSSAEERVVHLSGNGGGVRPLCVIPARRGSKRLADKNIAELGGRPMLAYTVEAALASELFDRVYVSTEDDTIARIAASLGAIAHARPARLAGDLVSATDVCLELLDLRIVLGEHHDAIVCLQPSSPLRNAADIRGAWEAFVATGADCLVSVTPIDPHYFHWALERDGEWSRMVFGDTYLVERPLLPPRMRPNGAIKIGRSGPLGERRDFFGPRLATYELPEERSVHVAERFDLRVAAGLLDSSFSRSRGS